MQTAEDRSSIEALEFSIAIYMMNYFPSASRGGTWDEGEMVKVGLGTFIAHDDTKG